MPPHLCGGTSPTDKLVCCRSYSGPDLAFVYGLCTVLSSFLTDYRSERLIISGHQWGALRNALPPLISTHHYLVLRHCCDTASVWKPDRQSPKLHPRETPGLWRQIKGGEDTADTHPFCSGTTRPLRRRCCVNVAHLCCFSYVPHFPFPRGGSSPPELEGLCQIRRG